MSSKGFKQVDPGMIKLARLCCLYSGYLYSKKQDQALYEYAMRIHLMEFAQANFWMHQLEYPLKDSHSGKGAPKSVDYVLRYNYQIIGIECKFPHKNTISNYKQKEDMEKLKEKFLFEKQVLNHGHRYVFLLTVCEYSVYKKINEKKFVNTGKLRDENWYQSTKLINIFDPGDSFITHCAAGPIRYTARIDKIAYEKN